jgi:hypothetical protein
VRQVKTLEKGKRRETAKVIPQCSVYVNTEKNAEVLEQYGCTIHVLFCQDLVGNHWDRFMDDLGIERQRLASDNDAQPKKEYKNYFAISKAKYARQRSVEYNIEKIKQHRNNYAGHICFITNDRTKGTASDALRELRACMNGSDDCKKLTRHQIFNPIGDLASGPMHLWGGAVFTYGYVE